MLSVNREKSNQIQVVCIEDLVPKNHFLRKVEKAVDWSFIYEVVEGKYCLDNGRPSIDPVRLFFSLFEDVFSQKFDFFAIKQDATIKCILPCR